MYMIVYVCICIYVIENRTNMRFDLFFFSIWKRQFFAKEHFIFSKLSRTPCLSFAGPMLGNNVFNEDRSQSLTARLSCITSAVRFRHAGSITESLSNFGETSTITR